MDTIKASGLALQVTGADMKVTNVTCEQVERDGKEAHDLIVEGSVNDTPMTITLPATTVAALATFGASVKFEKGARQAAFQTGIVIAASAEAGKQALSNFIYGKGRTKSGPVAVPQAEASVENVPEVPTPASAELEQHKTTTTEFRTEEDKPLDKAA
jgi:hypothetical protein